MNLDYKTTTSGDSLRTIHIIVIDAEILTTTRAKEVLQFAKARIQSRFMWKQLKEAVRLGESIQIRGGSDKYKHFNHHHELNENYEIVDFGDGEFVANKQAIPLLKALNEAGLRTRTHHIADGQHAFVSILLDNVEFEVKEVNEINADRTKYNGKKELLITWDRFVR